MRKKFFLIALLCLCSGCTTLRFPQPCSIESNIEQQLRWQAFEEAARGIMKYDTVRIDALRDRLEYKKEALRFSKKKERPALERDIAALNSRLENLSNLKIVLKRLETTKLFLEIESEQARQYVYRYLMLNGLKAKNIRVAPAEAEANYKLRVIVKQDGIDQQLFNLLFVFWSNKLAGTAAAEVIIVDLRTGEEVYKDSVQGEAFFTSSYLLGLIGPLNSSSQR